MSPKRQDITPRRLQNKGVRVFRENDRVLVMWRERGERKYQGFTDSEAGRKEALAYAAGVLARPQVAAVAGITLRQLWERFEEANAPTLRERTLQNYRVRWRKWELMWGHDFAADAVTLGMMDQFRAALTKTNAPNQVGNIIRVVKVVHNWADTRELVVANRIRKYEFKLGKDERKAEPEEFRVAQWTAILGQLGGGQDGRQWRAWVATMLAGTLGARIRAVLHLRWEDVDLEAGVVTWPAQFDKTGQPRRQPLTFDALAALLTARAQAARQGIASQWVIPAARANAKAAGRPGWAEAGTYRYQSWWYQFREAEARAGVPHEALRAAHGFRRMAAGEVWDRTGDAKLALDWIGDKDPRRMREYLKRRDDRMEDAARAMDTESAMPLPQPQKGDS